MLIAIMTESFSPSLQLSRPHPKQSGLTFGDTATAAYCALVILQWFAAEALIKSLRKTY